MFEPQNSTQQFWFVISGEDYQGPLTESELQNLLAGAAIARDSVVWHSGLENWKAIDEFPEFQPYLGLLPVLPEPALGPGFDFATEEPAPGVAFEAPKAAPPAPDEQCESNEAAWRRFLARQRGREEAREKARPKNEAFRERQVLRRPNLRAVAAVAAVVGAGLALVAWLVIRAGYAGSERTLNGLEGISTDDRGRLESAMRSHLRPGGARAAVAVSRIDEFAPSFIVAGNMPDGARLTLRIEGVPETLVGRFKVSMHTTVMLKDSVAKSPVFRQGNGSTYPLGQYKVKLFCETCPEPGAVLAEAAFFLGREVFAGEYRRQLSSYHAQLRKQALDELGELAQLSDSLENQLNETEAEFQRVLRLPVPDRWPEWKKYDQRWAAFEEQLEAIFSHWTPEALDGAYYYSELYSELKSAGDLVQANHQAQSAYVKLERRDPAQAASVDAETARIKSALTGLRAKIQSAQNLKVPTEGLPPRLPAF